MVREKKAVQESTVTKKGDFVKLLMTKGGYTHIEALCNKLQTIVYGKESHHFYVH
jgi:hypothetical protein